MLWAGNIYLWLFECSRDGIVECDTIEELRKLQGQRERRPRVQHRDTKPAGLELGELARRFLGLLLTTTEGLNTEEVATKLGIGPKSIPPILRSLKKWGRVKKHDLDGLMTRKMVYVNRRPVTIYNLTEEGRVMMAGKVQVPIPKSPPTPSNGKGINSE